MPSPGDVTALLQAWGNRGRGAESALIAAVYADLRRLARRRVRAGPDDSLTASALVHETYLKLIEQRRVRWHNRAQFFAIAARLMRRVVVDHARARAAAKRGGHRAVLDVSALGDLVPQAPAALGDEEILALHHALTRLKRLAARHGALVELRFFGGLSIEEAADVLEISAATAKRDWTFARAWLYRELSESAK